MTNQKRVGAGVPTGGQFDSHDRTEDTYGVLTDQLLSIAKQQADLRAQAGLVAGKILATSALDRYPTAASIDVQTSWDSRDHDWAYVHIYDAAGERLDDGEFHEDFADELRHLPVDDEPTWTLPVIARPLDDPRFAWMRFGSREHASSSRRATIDVAAAAEQEV